MKTLAFLALALVGVASQAQAAQEVTLDGVTLALPDGFRVVMAEPGGGAIPLEGVQPALDAARGRDLPSSYLIRDAQAAETSSSTDTVIRISDHTDGVMAEGRLMEDAYPASKSEFKDNVAPWTPPPKNGARAYWVKTSNERVPLVRVGCGVDPLRGCYLTAHLNGRLDLTMLSRDITEGPGMAERVDAALARLIP